MTRFAALCICLSLAALGHAQEVPVFSTHSPALTIATIGKDSNTVRFKGEISITGELVFEFRPDEGHNVFRARFIPDLAERDKLPQVIGGHYPIPLTHIDVVDPDRILIMTFGRYAAAKLSKGESPYASSRVTVTIRNFSTAIECDSRHYYSNITGVRRESMRTSLAKARNDFVGC